MCVQKRLTTAGASKGNGKVDKRQRRVEEAADIELGAVIEGHAAARVGGEVSRAAAAHRQPSHGALEARGEAEGLVGVVVAAVALAVPRGAGAGRGAGADEEGREGGGC